MKQQFLNWWNSLAFREQQLLSVAAVVVAISVFYFGVWNPISSAQQDAQADLKSAKQTLIKVKQDANRLIGYKQANRGQSRRGSLSNIVNQQADRFGLTISRMQPQGDKIQVWLDDAPFNDVLRYLDTLVVSQGLTVDSFDVASTDTIGVVRIRRIQLSR
ncbi:type II secretion system protein M [Parashewanella curva]|uniref:Type II secretion system protein M n=1 Tax=Parashewanella curva TaxID=2338552 RepID=A0A3L8PZ79_9GAMM|nr:type II secretion system protein M [Parashewanella curva]RLV60776.1 type II secretion system protein M [Parashewanella curva]